MAAVSRHVRRLVLGMLAVAALLGLVLHLAEMNQELGSQGEHRLISAPSSRKLFADTASEDALSVASPANNAGAAGTPAPSTVTRMQRGDPSSAPPAHDTPTAQPALPQALKDNVLSRGKESETLPREAGVGVTRVGGGSAEKTHRKDRDGSHNNPAAAASSTDPITDNILLDGPIIVGGSGGSGTRAVAKLLLELGVYVVVDDHNTWDVDEGFWVTAERELLPYVRAVRYPLAKVPAHVRRNITDMLRGFGQRLAARARAAAGPAGRTRWGFKAPCSQVFLPFWKEIFPRARFVHVVRDGRDIALSANREQQRYMKYISSGSVREPLAVKVTLWSTINTQVKAVAADLGLPYVTVRIEDVSSQHAAVVHELRLFLGLPALSGEQVCCVFSLVSAPMGTHDRAKALSNTATTFGKWRRLSATQQAALFHAAQSGLTALGYVDRSHAGSDTDGMAMGPVSEKREGALEEQGTRPGHPASTSLPRCNTTTNTCTPLYPDAVPELHALVRVAKAGGSLAFDSCSKVYPRARVLGTLRPYRIVLPAGTTVGTATTPAACCALCRASRGCSVFEFVYTHNECKLFNVAPQRRTVRESYWALGGEVDEPIASLPEDRIASQAAEAATIRGHAGGSNHFQSSGSATKNDSNARYQSNSRHNRIDNTMSRAGSHAIVPHPNANNVANTLTHHGNNPNAQVNNIQALHRSNIARQSDGPLPGHFAIAGQQQQQQQQRKQQH